MLKKLFSGRIAYLWGSLASFGLVALGLTLQVKYHLDPCPLCIFQRIAFIVLGLTFLLALIHNPSHCWRKLHAALQFIVATVGVGIALRHIWIQNNPDKVMSECGVGFDYLFQNFPFSRALDLIFKGTGECSSIDWTLLGLTIPQLSLIAFIGLGIYSILLVTYNK